MKLFFRNEQVAERISSALGTVITSDEIAGIYQTLKAILSACLSHVATFKTQLSFVLRTLFADVVMQCRDKYET